MCLNQKGKFTVQLINFDDVNAINELLEHIGVSAKLGPFLGEHLTQVLGQQQPDINIESIEFIGAGDCSTEGMQNSDAGHIVQIDALTIPLNVHVVLISNDRIHHLDLHVKIMAKSSDGKYAITTDVIIQRQSVV